MYNIIEYSDNYAKTLWSVWLYCRNKPDDDNDDDDDDDDDDDAEVKDSKSLKFKSRFTK